MLDFASLLGKSPLMVHEYIRNNSHVNKSDAMSVVQVVEKFKRIQSNYNDTIYINGLLNHYHYVVKHEQQTLNLNLYFNVVFVGKKILEDSLTIPYGSELERCTIS